MATQKHVTIALKTGATTVYLRNAGGQTFKIIYPGGQQDVTTVPERATTTGKVQTHTVGRGTDDVTITAPEGAQFQIVWDNGSITVNGSGGGGTPTLGASTANISDTGETSQRVNFTPVANASSYNVRRFTDANYTQQAEQKTVPAGGNAYADFTGLTGSTQYWYDVVPVANGYNSPAPARTNGSTTAPATSTNILARWVAYDAAKVPTENEILEMPGNGSFASNGKVQADWTSSINQPKYLTLATKNKVHTNWGEVGNAINSGGIGPSETFNVRGSVPATGGGTWSVIQSTSPTDFGNPVTFG